MTVYHVQELPSIDDPHLVRNCVCVQDMRRTLTAFFKHVLSQIVSHHVTASLRVTLAIVNRTAEQALSIELLCQKNCARDAAIILLSLHELRLDLQYIALDLDRAKIWIAHIQEKQETVERPQIRCKKYTSNRMNEMSSVGFIVNIRW